MQPWRHPAKFHPNHIYRQIYDFLDLVTLPAQKLYLLKCSISKAEWSVMETENASEKYKQMKKSKKTFLSEIPWTLEM